MRRLLALAVGIAATFFVAGCLGFGSDQPAAPQQQGPVVVPVINQSSDNSGWFVLITFIVVGAIVAAGLAARAWLRERDARRDAQSVTNHVLAVLPEQLHREVTYVLGYQPDLRVHRPVLPPTRQALTGGRDD